MRGIDYYTRTIFEFTSDALGAQSGVGGGGRYDGLIELLGGPPTPGMGWAAGHRADAARGRRAAGAARRSTDLFVAHEDRGGRGLRARRRGARARGSPSSRSSPGARSRASSSRQIAPAPATLPSWAPTASQLRDMDSGEQEAVESAAAAVARVIKGRHLR